MIQFEWIVNCFRQLFKFLHQDVKDKITTVKSTVSLSSCIDASYASVATNLYDLYTSKYIEFPYRLVVFLYDYKNSK